MQQVNKDGYKVVLSGTAADEIYSGYYEHFYLILSYWEKFTFI